MTDMLRNGQSWLAQKLKTHASRLVVYQRNDVEAELPATIGRSTYEQDDGEGVITRSQVRDFLIDTSDLLLSAIGSLPRRGDRISETDGDTTFIFEVMSLGGDPPWRYSDPFRLKIRIHTKQIDTIPA
ncbi:hypothetical protein [Planctomycetes bacterium TBK1r]|uniref:Phage head-tail joining protein domain-containing protein n=1 Tax=Stieleria magnilauensis TaxID=2527963 RepID=A0ABX5XV64_9BACT|nr:hypothetical protein TBK1r_44860 [Planctomycetes bacterium TBK1r]